ncbi:MAG: US12 family protein [Acidimicrobiales bacterium]|nr:US12 family protein [Acidimicrobiales bacterium]
MSVEGVFGNERYPTAAPSQGATLFGSTMEMVALTAGCFALGAFLGHDVSPGWGLVFYVVSLCLLIGMRSAVRRSTGSTVVLLLGFGLTLGVATGPTVAYYTGTDPAAVWQAAGATALFMAGLGMAGYATRRDLTVLTRAALWALVGLIVFGVIATFVRIPGSSLTYSIVGLAIFAVLVLGDFQRLRRVSDVESAPLMAASIFLDALNIFLFFLNLFQRRD